MKKALCMIALAAISFSSVFAHGTMVRPSKGIMQTDTTKKKKTKKMKKDTIMKKDTMKMKRK
ncbi:hypothetical protein SNE26_22615 [Mucilaginibacter sp. cycad4]|uniref:hypothetical protein n=1 Tax=Mucilaginibacter sp. cycad4 TaxID=3342096 RepID=UPI002AAAEE65|nr:hypothetical protein [Mucilaginibacter gossypii]WPU98812.1 hypothetical protein SNE26_22615 [Mucilaginibacter gossypii]